MMRLVARSASELPCDQRQVYNLTNLVMKREVLAVMVDQTLFRLKFVRSINVDSSPSCVLVFNSQLSDFVLTLVHFQC